MDAILWELLLFVALCSLGLIGTASLRIAWPGYVAAALTVPFGVVFTADTGINDGFREALEVSSDGSAFVWSAYAVMVLFATSLVVASRQLSKFATRPNRRSPSDVGI